MKWKCETRLIATHLIVATLQNEATTTQSDGRKSNQSSHNLRNSPEPKSQSSNIVNTNSSEHSTITGKENHFVSMDNDLDETPRFESLPEPSSPNIHKYDQMNVENVMRNRPNPYSNTKRSRKFDIFDDMNDAGVDHTLNNRKHSDRDDITMVATADSHSLLSSRPMSKLRRRFIDSSDDDRSDKSI
jgi:hypothetical protein